ncbi:NAD(P)-dependent dehydrogenase (short-subunit alcohol dehydrogenase family) [Bradyrhizobium sp. CIR48]|nr:NAD(P)-dependent dehydrogenase (short-subunit alcohol dehydrogenase family) [Bradyrhizobium sp. CIR48]
MKVTVLGAGVIGVTTAYQLAKLGHEVVVVDRPLGPALENQFCERRRGLLRLLFAVGCSGIPVKAVTWMLMGHEPLILRPKLDAAMLSWLFHMLAVASRPSLYARPASLRRLSGSPRVRVACRRVQGLCAFAALCIEPCFVARRSCRSLLSQLPRVFGTQRPHLYSFVGSRSRNRDIIVRVLMDRKAVCSAYEGNGSGSLESPAAAREARAVPGGIGGGRWC